MVTLVVAIAIVVTCALLMLIFAWPFMWMWNYAVVQAVTFANPIDYWIAVCLMMFLSVFVVSSNSKSSK